MNENENSNTGFIVAAVFVMLIIAGIALQWSEAGAASEQQVPMPTSAPDPLETPTSSTCDWLHWCGLLYTPLIMNWGSLDASPRTLSGRLIYIDKEPRADVVMRLGVIYNCTVRDGCLFTLDGGSSPATITDSDGAFEFQELSPSRYVILVHDLYEDVWWILASDDDGREIWSVYDDVDVGDIIFDVEAK